MQTTEFISGVWPVPPGGLGNPKTGLSSALPGFSIQIENGAFLELFAATPVASGSLWPRTSQSPGIEVLHATPQESARIEPNTDLPLLLSTKPISALFAPLAHETECTSAGLALAPTQNEDGPDDDSPDDTSPSGGGLAIACPLLPITVAVAPVVPDGPSPDKAGQTLERAPVTASQTETPDPGATPLTEVEAAVKSTPNSSVEESSVLIDVTPKAQDTGSIDAKAPPQPQSEFHRDVLVLRLQEVRPDTRRIKLTEQRIALLRAAPVPVENRSDSGQYERISQVQDVPEVRSNNNIQTLRQSPASAAEAVSLRESLTAKSPDQPIGSNVDRDAVHAISEVDDHQHSPDSTDHRDRRSSFPAAPQLPTGSPHPQEPAKTPDPATGVVVTHAGRLSTTTSEPDSPVEIPRDQAVQQPPNPIERILQQGRIVREIVLAVQEASDRSTQLRVTERNGQVEVLVSTTSPEVKSSAVEELPRLLERLEDAGYRAEGAKPEVVRSQEDQPARPGNTSAELQNLLDWQSRRDDQRQQRNRRDRRQQSAKPEEWSRIESLIAQAA